LWHDLNRLARNECFCEAFLLSSGGSAFIAFERHIPLVGAGLASFKTISWQSPDALSHPLGEESRFPAAEAALAALRADIDALGSTTTFVAPEKTGVPAGNLNVQRLFVPVDMVALLGGFLIAWVLSDAVNGAFFRRDVSDFWGALRPFELMAVIAGVLVWFEHAGHYRLRQPFWTETRKVVSCLGFAMLIDGFFQFVAKADFSRLWLTSGWLFAAALIVLGREALRSFLRRTGRWQIPTLVVGDGATASAFEDALISEPGLGYQVVRRINHFAEAWEKAGRSWQTLCADAGAVHVVLAHEGGAAAPSDEALAQLTRERLSFALVPPVSPLPVFGVETQGFLDHDILLLSRVNNLEQPLSQLVKRSMDLVVAGTALVVLSPLILVLAALVKMDGGTVFYGHPRLGLGGHRFACWKFRTMVPDGNDVLARYLLAHGAARESWLRDRKLKFDPRVTRLGRWLRRLSLDELPQLFNVMMGQMSLVGPRPIVVAEAPRYDHDIAHYYRVRPGITGLWQISGRSDVSYDERVRMDSWYVRNWSLWNDIVILLKTVPVLIRRTGAY
jgi:Undecaprenyl-phosphate galactose phosphotransferase WbaP